MTMTPERLCPVVFTTDFEQVNTSRENSLSRHNK